MLELRRVSFSMHSKTLLDTIDLHFQTGKLNVVVGPNGAGKSTLLKLLSRQIAPSQGEILYHGKSMASYALTDLARRRAVLSQHIELAFPISVRELVMMGRYPYFSGRPSKNDQQIVDELLDYCELNEMQMREVSSLSGGERQRVQLARVLAQIWQSGEEHAESAYLLLDEPLSYLDVFHQLELMHKLQSLVREKKITVIAIVHDLNLAAKFADYLCLLHQGRLLAVGAAHEVLSEAHVQTAYRIKPSFHEIEGQRRLFFI